MSCANCGDYHRSRRWYETQCELMGQVPLPQMVSPATLMEAGTEFPTLNGPASTSLGFIALMLESARP
ncbi:hypothetical protein ASE14_06470 [Agromyces sp. Root81]|nr:hypothetical protein ASE14_06470 [Agromyces sp. Root81]